MSWVINLVVACCADNSAVEGGLSDIPIEVLHQVLSHLVSPTDREAFGISVDQKESFIKALGRGLFTSIVDFSVSFLLIVLTLMAFINNWNFLQSTFCINCFLVVTLSQTLNINF